MNNMEVNQPKLVKSFDHTKIDDTENFSWELSKHTKIGFLYQESKI